MKILHTSDWHIGQRLHGKEREVEHELFFKWLLNFIEEQRVEVLLVAGDIFDVGYPPNSALRAYFRFLTRLINTSCRQVIITGGNHDQISTLEAPREVLEYLNVTVIGGAREEVADELIPICDEQGEMKLQVAAVPFLRDRDLRRVTAGESYEDRLEAIKQGICTHYQILAEAVEDQKLPVIAMGHFYMQGASLSDSEREIQIGNLAAVSAENLDHLFDYWALGHIHKPQRIGGKENMRYCGSPIALSFSERKDTKEVILLEVEEELKITSIPVPAFRPLVRFGGSLDEVKEALNSYHVESELPAWVELQVEEEDHDPALIRAFEEFLEEVKAQREDLQVIKPHLTFKQAINGASQLYDPSVSLQDLSAIEVFDALLDNGDFAEKETLKQSFAELLDFMNHEQEGPKA